jgi:hypothetical protein
LPTYEPSYAPSYLPRIRVEVYIPKRFAPEYRNSLAWLIGELTKTYGGCTVHENASGYYCSKDEAIIDEPMSLVYSDFNMDWDQPAERAEVLTYCAALKQLLSDNLSEEEILITAFPISHVTHTASV